MLLSIVCKSIDIRLNADNTLIIENLETLADCSYQQMLLVDDTALPSDNKYLFLDLTAPQIPSKQYQYLILQPKLNSFSWQQLGVLMQIAEQLLVNGGRYFISGYLEHNQRQLYQHIPNNQVDFDYEITDIIELANYFQLLLVQDHIHTNGLRMLEFVKEHDTQ